MKVVLLVVACAMTLQAKDNNSSSSSSATTTSGGSSSPQPITRVISPLALRSPDILRIEALGTIVKGSRYVSSESMDYNSGLTSTNVTGNGAEDVMSKLFAVEFTYKLLNPGDTISSYIYLRDGLDNLVFYGTAEYKRDQKPVFRVWFYQVPVFQNVESAEVLALREDGTTGRTTGLDVKNGQVMLAPWYAGKQNAIIAVRYEDGKVATFRIDAPVATQPNVTKEGKQLWAIDGHYNYEVGTKPLIATIIETWTRPTLAVKSGGAFDITLDVSGLVQDDGEVYFERPAIAYVVTAFGEVQRHVLLAKGATKISVKNAGPVARIYFEWVKFALPGTIYAGPDTGGNPPGGLAGGDTGATLWKD